MMLLHLIVIPHKAKYHDDKNTISNQDGIEIEHALATGTFPDFFDYPKFKVKMDG